MRIYGISNDSKRPFLLREEEDNKIFIISHLVNPRISALKTLCVLQISKSAHMFLEEMIKNANIR